MLFNTKIKTIATTLAFSYLISGCFGVLGTGIKEENRDTTGAYDGIWVVEVQKAASLQTYGQWDISCGDMRRTFNIRVLDGTMDLGSDDNANKTFVSSNGKFKAILPMSVDAKASGSSSTTLANGDMKLILSGTLVPSGDKSAGYITYGIAEMGYGGCTAKTKYTLATAANKANQS